MSDIELTLNGNDTGAAGAAVEPTDLVTIRQQAALLTPEEEQKVDEFAAKIDLHDTAMIARYGEVAQSRSAQFSESVLNGVKGRDLDAIGDMITALVVEIKGFKPEEEKKGLSRLFQKGRNYVEEMRARYNDVSKNIDAVSDTLKGHRLTLLADVTVLDKLFESNLQYFKELTMYIAAGKQKLADVENGELRALQQKAAASGLQEDAQRAGDLAEQCNRFEKRIYDLELTRTICIQMAPQIRMIQNTDLVMADKIQTSVANTIPLWKNQILLALGLEHSKRAIQAQQQVSEITNRLLKENAEKLKLNTIEAARESERGIVDIETLVQTNENIIATLDEVLVIQQQGKERRREAEQQLVQIENQLKTRLIAPREPA
ncbi:MAG: toxic anion resistance protein [Firmicutes bacterium]|nr:toxic anion resistance protein [Bacillota bacterium]